MTRDEMIEAGARALAALSCRCGHRQDQHDPEDGDCESARGFVKCPCRAFRTSDPNETTAEYRAAAVVDAIHPDEYEQVGWKVPTEGAIRFYLWASTDVPPGGFPEPVVPVYIVREAEG